jgi:hypothetical protein
MSGRHGATPAPDPGASALARHADPSLAAKPAASPQPASTAPARAGWSWVRASDLLGGGAGRIAGRGIDLHAELARRTRRLPRNLAAASRRAVARKSALPPPGAFGAGPRPPAPGPAIRRGIR